MTDAVETMAYAETGGVPWHGLGNPVSNRMSPAQMQIKAGCDWTVSKEPLFCKVDGPGAYTEIKDRYGLVRNSDNSVLSIVGGKYKPVQNDEVFDFFKKYCNAGHMQMETAGALWGGRYVWALARIGKDFSIGREDEVRGYLLLASPHVCGKALMALFTPIRVVCWNTLTAALGSARYAFRMSHSVYFNDDAKKSAELALGIATEQMTEFKQSAILLSKKKISEVQAKNYFCEVLEFNPKEATKKKKKGEEVKPPRLLPKFQEALNLAPGQQLPGAEGTLWGALNAVTYVVDHQMGMKDRGTALKTAWFGHTAELKRRALKVAIDRAT